MPEVKTTVKGFDERWDRKRCNHCKHMRRVKVHITHYVKQTQQEVKRQSKSGATWTDTEVIKEEHSHTEEYWAPLCQACDLLQRAENHERSARKFRLRARNIMAERKRKAKQ